MNKAIRILAVIAIVTFSIKSFSDNKADVDLWGNVGFVTALPWSPAFQYTNTFSFTEPEHIWINHEWLSEYILNRVYSVFGPSGLILLKILLGLALITLVNMSIKKDCRSGAVRFFFLILIISTIGYGFSFRPHLFTYLMLALFLYVLRHLNRNRLVLMSLPVLFLAWTNLHGAFFIGIVLMIIFIIAEAIKAFRTGTDQTGLPDLKAMVLLLAILVGTSFLNPYGPDLWRFIFESAVTPRPYLSEWAPFNPLAHFSDHTDFMVLTVISVAAVIFSKKRRDKTWLIILIVAFLGALLLRRNIPVFAIVSCFVIPQYLDGIAAQPLQKIVTQLPRFLAAGVLAIFIAFSSWYIVAAGKVDPLKIEVHGDRYPTEVINFVKENRIRGNLLVFFDWAEYCIWHIPGCKVFLDGRFTDAYDRHTVSDYIGFLYLEKNWENALSRYPVNMVLLHKGNPSYTMMSLRGGWKLVCEDPISGLFLETNVHRQAISALTGLTPVAKKSNPAAFFP